MKKVFGLSAICLTTALLSSCGAKQETTPAVPAAEAVAWSDTLRYVNGKYEYNCLEIRGYNAEGKLAVVDIYDVKDNKETLAEQKIYQGGLLAYVKGLDEKGAVNHEETYVYTDGRLTEVLTKDFDVERQKMMESAKLVYKYNEQQDIASIKETVCKNLRWMDSYEWTYTYKDGKVVDRKDFAYEEVNSKMERKQSRWELYEYNENGQLQTYNFYFYDVKQGRQKHDSKTSYEYNKKGQLIKASVERHKNTRKREPILSRIYNFDYNEAGQLTYFDRQKYSAKTKQQTGEFATNNSYDEQGRLLLSQSLSITRPKTESVTISYTYPAEAKATTLCEANKVNYFVPVRDGKPVVDVTENNKTLTELEDEK